MKYEHNCCKKLIKNLLPKHKEHKNGHDTYDAKTRENRSNAKQKADERYNIHLSFTLTVYKY